MGCGPRTAIATSAPTVVIRAELRHILSSPMPGRSCRRRALSGRRWGEYRPPPRGSGLLLDDAERRGNPP